jgi:hypothetical protein
VTSTRSLIVAVTSRSTFAGSAPTFFSGRSDLLSSDLVGAVLESSNGIQLEGISLAERCPMTTHSQPGLETYRRPLQAIAADQDNRFGLYLRPNRHCEIHVCERLGFRLR